MGRGFFLFFLKLYPTPLAIRFGLIKLGSAISGKNQKSLA